MTHYETVVEELVTPMELHALAKGAGPCISATVNIPDPAHLRPGINNTIRELEKRLKAARSDARTAQTLLEPLRELAATIETDGDWAIALAIYRSADILHCFRVPEVVKEFAKLEDVFEIRPLLPVVSRQPRFYLLALSQKKVRLLDCSRYRTREIDLEGRVPHNLQTFLNTRMPGVLVSTIADREKREEHLLHFFQEIDKGLHKILAVDAAPLLLAGVEYEVATYRRVNTYKQLLDANIHGSPDGLSLQQLHEQALELVRKSFSAPLEKLMREFPSYRDGKRVTFELPEILDKSASGRISHVLLREDAEGRQLNLAALRTLAHGGEAYALTESEMPDQADIAGVVRY